VHCAVSMQQLYSYRLLAEEGSRHNAFTSADDNNALVSANVKDIFNTT